jgi:hypothetical protein
VLITVTFSTPTGVSTQNPLDGVNECYRNDYRYSQLTNVFGKLLHERRLGDEELRGLRENKLKSIRSYAKFLAEMDAA